MAAAAAELEKDYVARIARLIVLWPDEDDRDSGGARQRIGFKRPGEKKQRIPAGHPATASNLPVK
jgi:hypothetical protein